MRDYISLVGHILIYIYDRKWLCIKMLNNKSLVCCRSQLVQVTLLWLQDNSSCHRDLPGNNLSTISTGIQKIMLPADKTIFCWFVPRFILFYDQNCICHAMPWFVVKSHPLLMHIFQRDNKKSCRVESR